MRESNVSMSLFGRDNSLEHESGVVSLDFHAYQYFPYEKELARRELTRIAGLSSFDESQFGVKLHEPIDISKLRSLTYFAGGRTASQNFSTIQHGLEESHRRVAGTGKRQATRYSVHGLHEYKGRFNPQIVRFLLNYLGVTSQTRVLDPFCGSGTTVAEAAIHGFHAVGIDENPFAVFLCNAKVKALTVPAQEICTSLRAVLKAVKRSRRSGTLLTSNERLDYLKKWFPVETLQVLEDLRMSIQMHAGRTESILLALVSDLIRAYSFQEPSDLRIRRRISPLPSEPFLEALERKANTFVASLEEAQKITGVLKSDCEAIIGDSRQVLDQLKTGSRPHYDYVITSPPYATALPYIDTQRLSLVWLGLSSVADIRRLEASAIGSREFTGNASDWRLRLRENADSLPKTLATFCSKLDRALLPVDGFRRRATPALIYRYFTEMRQAFSNMREVLSKGARLAFVVGTNQTTLGGKRFTIDSAEALASIAVDLGFRIAEVVPLETYQRYGLHQKNSIHQESLTILEWH